MKLLKRSIIALFVLLILAGVAVYLIPLDAYVPQIERSLGEQLHTPVSIRHARVAALPLPHLELQGVRLGEREGIAAQSVEVELDMRGLLEGKVVLRRIAVKEGTAHLAQVRQLVEGFSNQSDAAQVVTVRELQLSGMSLLVTPELTIGPLEGKLEFEQNGQLERVWFAMDEQKAMLVLQPLPERRFSLLMQARGWMLPQLRKFPLDDLQIEGVLSEQDFTARKFVVATRGIRAEGDGKVEFSDGWRLQTKLARVDTTLERAMALLEKQIELTGPLSVTGTLSSKADTARALQDHFRFDGKVRIGNATARIVANAQSPLRFKEIRSLVSVRPERLEMRDLKVKLYGGELSGTVSINRSDTLLDAEIAVSNVAMQPLVEALTNEVLFTGNMDSKAKFSMRLDAFERFPENMKLAGEFHLRNGMLSKVDLVQAASSSGTANAKGGKTGFDDLSGLLNIDAGGYHFRRLKISSGSLSAEGKIDISPSLQLNGMLDTDVKGTIGLVSMPMVVAGTLDDPVVRPSGSAMAGAAVGTALLGPGIGTAVGIKVGGFLNKLFGKNDDKKGEGKTPVKPPEKK
ncbi:MAG: AsmA family protein [Nitrosomonadales bacterium]|nr:AsmA family protein [Nitrosomonadales bacterium]